MTERRLETMHRVRLDELEPGMVTAQPVHNLQGILLLGEGAVLTDRTIQVLKTWGVPSVYVRDGGGSGGGDEGTDGELSRTIQEALDRKFSRVPDHPVMREIRRVAAIQIRKRLRSRPN